MYPKSLNYKMRKHMRYFFVCSLVFISINQFCFSQNDSTYFHLPKDKKKESKKNYDWLKNFTIGGNFAVYASSRFTYVDISPIIGYRISKPLLVGAGPVYTYYSEEYNSGRYKFDVYGFRTIARLYVLQTFFFQTGWDKLNRSIYYVSKNNNTLQEARIWIDNVWIGGGIRYSMGGNNYMFTTVLFNLNQNDYSIYANPYVQVGFIIGF